jgi:two-component system, LytTR family, response regulator
MRVLIVDDEPLALTALAQILAARADVEHFDAAPDALEAQQRLSKDVYDVMLLDINMPEVSGLELLGRLQRSDRPAPSVVLVTAHSEHAVAAFEKHAVDYVLKPFTRERVNQALDFAAQRTASERAVRLVELMPHLRPAAPPASSKIAIKNNGRILFIEPRELAVVQAEGNYVLLQQESGSYLLRESISTIAEKLKPYGFVRIHRSVLVNASFVRELRPCSTGEYELRLKDGKEFTVTRTYKKNLRALARYWVGAGAFPPD